MNSTTTNINDEELREFHGIMIIIQFLQAIIVTGSNGLLIAVYVLLGPLQRKNGNYLILTQAFADMFIGALLWYEIVALNMNDQSDYTNILQVIYSALLEYSFTVCVGTLLINAVERHTLVTRPIYHKHSVTTTRLKKINVLLWVTALIPAMSLIGLMHFDISQSNSHWVIRYSYVFNAVVIMMLCGIAIIHWISLKAASQYNYLQGSHIAYEDVESAPSLVVVKDTKLIKLFAISCFIFTVTYLPMFFGRLFYDMGLLDSMGGFEHIVLVNACLSLYKVSAICNPIMALTIQRDYKEKLSGCFTVEARYNIEIVEEEEEFVDDDGEEDDEDEESADTDTNDVEITSL